MTKIKILGFVQVLLAGVGFGFLGIFGKLLFATGLEVGTLLSFRFLFASLILTSFLALANRSLLKISLPQLLVCAVLGVAGYALFASFYFKAIQGLSVSLAALLLYTYPLMTSLGARFLFNERLAKSQWISLPLMALGLVVLLWGELSVGSIKAVFFGLGSALSYTAYVMYSHRVQQNINPLTSGVYVSVLRH